MDSSEASFRRVSGVVLDIFVYSCFFRAWYARWVGGVMSLGIRRMCGGREGRSIELGYVRVDSVFFWKFWIGLTC